jgi:hypothetical protein
MMLQLAERLAEEVEDTLQVARDCGAVLRTTETLAERGALAAGVLPTALQIAETLLRASAHRGAVAEISRYGCWLMVRIAADMHPHEWRVQRVRDRLAWFDGHLRVEPAGAGSRVTVALPMS